jgi:hypothetical protein
MTRLSAELARGLAWLTLVAVCDLLDLGLWTLAVIVAGLLLSSTAAVLIEQRNGRIDWQALERARRQAEAVARALEHRPVDVPGLVDGDTLAAEVGEALHD